MADIIVNQTVQAFDVKVKYNGFSFTVKRTIFINQGSQSSGVSSVAISGTDGIQVDSGSPITSSGTITLGIDAPALIEHLGIVSNANHTGDATGATALELQPVAISGKPLNNNLSGTEEILINNSGTLQKTLISNLGSLNVVVRNSNTIEFDREAEYYTPTTATTGNITFDFTNAKKGIIQKLYHEDSNTFTLPAEAVLLNGFYQLNELNILYFEYVDNNRVEYWVEQEGNVESVDSVNGQIGVVVLDADDIDDSATTNKFATAAQLSQIATNESDITALQNNRLLEVQAGANITVDNTDPLRPIVSSTGGGGGKQKQYIQVTGLFNMGTVNTWTTFFLARGWNDDDSVTYRGTGATPTFDGNDMGLTIPQGYKINKTIIYLRDVFNTDVEFYLAKKDYNAGNGDYKGAGTVAYDYFELSNELLFNPWETGDNGVLKKTVLADTTSGVNEFADRDGQIIPYMRCVDVGDSSVVYTFIFEIEEI